MGRVIIGIDPGVYGAMVSIVDSDVGYMTGLPYLGNDLLATSLAITLRELQQNPAGENHVVVAYIEKPFVMPKQSGQDLIMINFGRILAAMEILGIAYEVVLPRAWKSKVLAGMDWQNKKTTTKNAKTGEIKTTSVKNTTAITTYCVRRYPSAVKDILQFAKKQQEGFFDAIGIARFGELKELGS